jgi:hypothetical protein
LSRLSDEIEKYLKCASTVPLLPANTFVSAPAAIPKEIGAVEAKNYYDETMRVTGKVVGIMVRPTVAILDIDNTENSWSDVKGWWKEI